MTNPWDVAHEPASLGNDNGSVTLIDGRAFCISSRSGNIRTGTTQGLFVDDQRLINLLEIEIDGETLDPISASNIDPRTATFISRNRPPRGEGTSTLLVIRRRTLMQGLSETLTFKNFSKSRKACSVILRIDSDFAGVFEVKVGTVKAVVSDIRQDGLCIELVSTKGADKGYSIIELNQQPSSDVDGFSFPVEIESGGEWVLEIRASSGKQLHEQSDGSDDHNYLAPIQLNRGYATWRSAVTRVSSNYAPLDQAIATGIADLGALRIFDPQYSRYPIVAAGAPWFMTLFGRDALITSWMALMVDPSIAIGTLEALSRFQGSTFNEDMDEEPGKILHEVRPTTAGAAAYQSSSAYYGSADATPLFVMLLGEVRRWGLAQPFVEGLVPHADRALEWIERFGDRDGDGYVEYTTKKNGLPNLGWKDSVGALQSHRGIVADEPVALLEVQAYTYAAYLARAHFADEANDIDTYVKYVGKAASLREAFNRDFWMPEHSCFAIALDGDKRPVDSVTSNVGHALWAGIVDPDKAAAIAKRLVAPDMFTGWGIRTLSSDCSGYNPLGYHTGTVWPHDSAIAASGLMRYGFEDEAHRIILGILESAVDSGGRLPEVFTGISRDDVEESIPYPTACSPQAWAAAAPLLALRSLLRFEPSVPGRELTVAPSLPREIRSLKVSGIPLWSDRVSIHIEGDHFDVTGVSDDIAMSNSPRPPTMNLLEMQSKGA